MYSAHQLVDSFCQIDDFCKQLEIYTLHGLLPNPNKTKRGPACKLDDSEIMTILILFQMSGFRNFKTFYLFLTNSYHKDFPGMPSYNRFIEIMRRVIFPLTLFLQINQGKKTGIYFIDSSCLPVCHIKRSKRHKTFDSIAKYGKTSVGWFFGLKLHLVINHFGQIMACKITKGNISDCKVAPDLLKNLSGLSFGDKGYLGKKLFSTLLSKGLKLITRKRKNMKDKGFISAFEKQVLDKRGIIETVIGHLKEHYQIWHTRHRSAINAITHLLAGMVTYTIAPLKISAIQQIEKTIKALS